VRDIYLFVNLDFRPLHFKLVFATSLGMLLDVFFIAFAQAFFGLMGVF
jgi:hypothetical protein